MSWVCHALFCWKLTRLLCAEAERRKAAKKPRSGSSVPRGLLDPHHGPCDPALGARGMQRILPYPSDMRRRSGCTGFVQA